MPDMARKLGENNFGIYRPPTQKNIWGQKSKPSVGMAQQPIVQNLPNCEML